MNEDIVNAGFDAQSPEPETTPANAEQPAPAPNQETEPDPAQVLWQSSAAGPARHHLVSGAALRLAARAYAGQSCLCATAGNAAAANATAHSAQPTADGPVAAAVVERRVAHVAERSAAVVKSRAQEDGLELSDNDLQQIFLNALERYAGDIDSAYASFAYPRLKARNAQKQQSRREGTGVGAI
jgi:hypothetical protein